MFAITVAFGSMSCLLLYKTEEAANNNWQTIIQASCENVGATLKDEFGRLVCIPNGQLNGASFENLDLSKEGQIETGLHQARTQANAQKRAQTDPILRAAQMGAGPGVITPMGMPNGRLS